MNTDPYIFIVGNSRSGTTMLMRIFNQHSQVHTINETHFMERHWKRSEEESFLKPSEAAEFLLGLVSKQRDGFFAPDNEDYRKECEALVSKLGPFDFTKVEILKRFMQNEAALACKSRICEKTPQHVFYISELLRLFPNSKVINMVRDPRSVLASQKNKWKRRKLGSTFMPEKESLRLRLNYHPLTMSQLWNASVGAAESMENHPQVISIRYEELLQQPQETVNKLCSFTEVPFEPNMLKIAVASSSLRADNPNEIGIHAHSLDSWRAQLSKHEIQIVQQRCGKRMKRWGYELDSTPSISFKHVVAYVTYPFKILLALAVNRSRLKNLVGAIGRRLTHITNPKPKMI